MCQLRVRILWWAMNTSITQSFSTLPSLVKTCKEPDKPSVQDHRALAKHSVPWAWLMQDRRLQKMLSLLNIGNLATRRSSIMFPTLRDWCQDVHFGQSIDKLILAQEASTRLNSQTPSATLATILEMFCHMRLRSKVTRSMNFPLELLKLPITFQATMASFHRLISILMLSLNQREKRREWPSLNRTSWRTMQSEFLAMLDTNQWVSWMIEEALDPIVSQLVGKHIEKY